MVHSVPLTTITDTLPSHLSFSLGFSLSHQEVFICKYLDFAFPRKAHLKPPQLSVQQLVYMMPVSAFQMALLPTILRCSSFFRPISGGIKQLFTKGRLRHYWSKIHAKLHKILKNCCFVSRDA